MPCQLPHDCLRLVPPTFGGDDPQTKLEEEDGVVVKVSVGEWRRRGQISGARKRRWRGGGLEAQRVGSTFV